MRALASCWLAFSTLPKMRGASTPMIVPRMMSTMTSSSREKPSARREASLVFMERLRKSERKVVEREHGGEHRQDDSGDDDGHPEDHRRLEEGEHLADRLLDFDVVGLGHLQEHFVQAPRFLAHEDHVHGE